ncbi:hypothetical protein PV327_003176 [Microctonus hyperodae]|uniref:Uncharacterized protein n=1 Tax=Microctonus hyperodae TaxID=165561 RepID=A0AA39L0X0_MICHY|nr:hypothetical protein PV327_003176 [Microctonus hyperodae]
MKTQRGFYQLSGESLPEECSMISRVIFELSCEYRLKRNYLPNGKILAVGNINTRSQVFETTHANIRRHPSTEMTWMYFSCFSSRSRKTNDEDCARWISHDVSAESVVWIRATFLISLIEINETIWHYRVVGSTISEGGESYMGKKSTVKVVSVDGYDTCQLSECLHSLTLNAFLVKCAQMHSADKSDCIYYNMDKMLKDKGGLLYCASLGTGHLKTDAHLLGFHASDLVSILMYMQEIKKALNMGF